jgi:hypothetical protein
MTSASESQPEFVFQKDGVDYLKLCLEVTVYWASSIYDQVEGILDFYEQSLGLLKKDLRQYITKGVLRRVKKDSFEILPLWLTKPKARHNIMTLTLDGATTRDGASDRAFILRAIESKKTGLVRLVLPVDFFATSATPFVELAKSLVRKLNFSFGHAGYSVNWNDWGDLSHKAELELYPLGRRHPGIDLPNLNGMLFVIPKGIKCINWLTFLNADYCEQLGGWAQLHEDLGKDIIVHELPTGVMIQAGERPEIGDVNRRRRLPLYRKVGKVLASLRSPTHPPFLKLGGLIAEDDATQEWLARFDS